MSLSELLTSGDCNSREAHATGEAGWDYSYDGRAAPMLHAALTPQTLLPRQQDDNDRFMTI